MRRRLLRGSGQRLEMHCTADGSLMQSITSGLGQACAEARSSGRGDGLIVVAQARISTLQPETNVTQNRPIGDERVAKHPRYIP